MLGESVKFRTKDMRNVPVGLVMKISLPVPKSVAREVARVGARQLIIPPMAVVTVVRVDMGVQSNSVERDDDGFLSIRGYITHKLSLHVEMPGPNGGKIVREKDLEVLTPLVYMQVLDLNGNN